MIPVPVDTNIKIGVGKEYLVYLRILLNIN
jgi:hypothetical protein